MVARRSIEVEFRVAAHGICELLLLKKLLKCLKIPSSMPMKLYYDNNVAINIAHNLGQHDRTKTWRLIVILLKRNSREDI